MFAFNSNKIGCGVRVEEVGSRIDICYVVADSDGVFKRANIDLASLYTGISQKVEIAYRSGIGIALVNAWCGLCGKVKISVGGVDVDTGLGSWINQKGVSGHNAVTGIAYEIRG